MFLKIHMKHQWKNIQHTRCYASGWGPYTGATHTHYTYSARCQLRVKVVRLTADTQYLHSGTHIALSVIKRPFSNIGFLSQLSEIWIFGPILDDRLKEKLLKP